MRLKSCLMALLVVASPGSGSAQVMEYRESKVSEDGHGLARGNHGFYDRLSPKVVPFVTAKTLHPEQSLSVAVSLRGPTVAEPLNVLAAATDAKAAMAWSFGEDVYQHHGVIKSGQRLFRWERGDGEHLLMAPEGSLSVESLEDLSGTVTAPDLEPLRLLSINGALPDAPGEVTVYTGDLDGRKLPLALWPESLLAVPLSPVVPGADPHTLFLETEFFDQRWRPGAVVNRPFIRSDAQGAILLFQPPIPDPWLAAFEGEVPLTVTVTLGRKTEFSQLILPLPDPLVTGGVLLDTERKVWNGLAVDLSTQRIMMLGITNDSARYPESSATALLPFLQKEGFSEFYPFDAKRSLLLADPAEDKGLNSPGTNPATVALVVNPTRQQFRLPSQLTEMVRRYPDAIQGTFREFRENQPRSVVDGRTGFSPDLRSFWAVESTASEPAELYMIFSKPQPLALIDLVHAESAGFSPEFNLKGYRISYRDRPGGPWLELRTMDHAEPTARDRLKVDHLPPLSALKLEVITPNFHRGGTLARLSEMVLWGKE